MANIDKFVSVTVTKTSASVTRQGFGTPLGVFQVSTSIIPTRYMSFTSQLEMVTAGFATTDPAYIWAGTILGQDVAPSQFAVGRRGQGTAQVDALTITTPDAGDWVQTVDGRAFTYTADGGDTNLTIAQGLMDVILAVDSSLTDLNGTAVTVPGGTLVSATFDVTAWVAGEAFVNGGLVSPGSGVGTFVNTTANAAAENITTALDAIIVENDTWYGLNVESRQNDDILLANTWVSTQVKVFVATSSDQTSLTGTAGNIGLLLGATGNRRTELFWHHQPKLFADGAMLGRALALDLDAENGHGTWALQQLRVVTPSNLNSSQQANLDTGNSEYLTSVGGLNISNNGQSVQGEFMDVQTTLDWTSSRIQEDVFAALATTPTKVALTNAGIAIIKAAVLGVLKRGVTNGHYTDDNPLLPKVDVPDSTAISTADRNARILRNVIGEAQLAQAIHEVLVQVNVLA